MWLNDSEMAQQIAYAVHLTPLFSNPVWNGNRNDLREIILYTVKNWNLVISDNEMEMAIKALLERMLKVQKEHFDARPLISTDDYSDNPLFGAF